MIHQIEILLPAYPKGCHLIQHQLERHLGTLPAQGICLLFLQHTSAALSINENADPSVRSDLSRSLDVLAPENASQYTHTDEGPDDMPAHVKTSVLGVSLSIPIRQGRLALGTWQGVYLCEFRQYAGPRRLLATIYS